MTAHTPYVAETISADCVERECEHASWEDCPTTPVVACAGCTEPGDWHVVTEWPCLFATRRGREDEVEARLLAEAAPR